MSSDSEPECNGIFETCLSTAAMAGVLFGIIVAGALVMAIPFTHCAIQQRRQKAAEAHARHERLESVRLQLRTGQPTDDNVRDASTAAAGSGGGALMSGAIPAVDVDAITPAPPSGGVVNSSAMPCAMPAVRDFAADADAVTPVPPASPPPAHVHPLRQHPVDLEKGLLRPKTQGGDRA